MNEEWTDRLAGARMQVDQRFSGRVVESQFSNQQWGLIMTAVEFDVENPQKPAEATLIAKTEQLEHIIPELDKADPTMGGPAPAHREKDDSDGGFIDAIGRLVPGMSSEEEDGIDEDTLEAAGKLADEYAAELQAYLEEQGSWADICESVAASEQ